MMRYFEKTIYLYFFHFLYSRFPGRTHFGGVTFPDVPVSQTWRCFQVSCNLATSIAFILGLVGIFRESVGSYFLFLILEF